MEVYAVIVTYNGMRWYDHCLGSLRDSDLHVSTIVVDNASTDNTADYIKENFPDVHLISSGRNLGFAKANNIGIRYAIDNEADYVFLLNQDAWIEKDTLSKLVKTFEENTDAGIVSPIHLNGSYTGLDWGFASYMKPVFVSDLYVKQLKPCYEVPLVNAAAWLLSAHCIKTVGGFDTHLFLHYGEDYNYCQRVKYHSFRILINTRCTICHDREQRKDNEAAYRKIMIEKNPGMMEKVIYGDINIDYNINRILLKKYVFLVLSCLGMSFKRINIYKTSIAALRDVKYSREKNKQIGLTWLSQERTIFYDFLRNNGL